MIAKINVVIQNCARVQKFLGVGVKVGNDLHYFHIASCINNMDYFVLRNEFCLYYIALYVLLI